MFLSVKVETSDFFFLKFEIMVQIQGLSTCKSVKDRKTPVSFYVCLFLEHNFKYY